jgi:hypothetical protein
MDLRGERVNRSLPMFRFSIREKLLVTLVVGLALGWWLHARRLQSDLLYQADLVDSFAYALVDLGCEIPEGTGPHTKIIVPEVFHSYAREKGKSASLSFTTSVPREQLQRTLNGEFNRFRAER